VPQNRERVFLVGIRDDKDNSFAWPIEEQLKTRLKDVLEDDCDKKYFLSENNIEKLIQYDIRQKENGNGFGAKFHDEDGTMSALKVGGSGCDDLVKIKSATLKGYEEATEGDSINLAVPNSETRRGRVGKQVAQTLDTGCNQGVIQKYQKEIEQSLSQDICTGIDASYYKGFGVRQGKCRQVVQEQFKIRRLTPRECFRLMDFPDTFTWPVSDSQAYKQAGNSIVVRVLAKIIERFKL
jgi:DNA (cytosine-5)-methyltransferase 1